MVSIFSPETDIFFSSNFQPDEKDPDDPWEHEVAVDSFTLIHHDLQVSRLSHKFHQLDLL